MTPIAAYSPQGVAVALPLIIALVMTLATVLIYAVALIGIVHFIRHHHRLGHTGVRFWRDVAIFSCSVLLAGAANLIEISMWAVVFLLCGEVTRASVAFYNSAMLYTSLGFGDVAMSSSWKLLGPFETANAMLAFGVSTAIAISVIQLMVRKRFQDLPNF